MSVSSTSTVNELKLKALVNMGVASVDCEEDENEKHELLTKYNLINISPPRIRATSSECNIKKDVPKHPRVVDDVMSGGRNLVLVNSTTLAKQDVRLGSELLLVRKSLESKSWERGYNSSCRVGRYLHCDNYHRSPDMSEIQKATAHLPLQNGNRKAGQLQAEDLLVLRDEELISNLVPDI